MMARTEYCDSSTSERNRRRSLAARAAAVTALTLSSLVAAGCLSEDADGEQPDNNSQEAIGWTLGARYDATNSNINFSVYSSAATRVEVYIYKDPIGADEVAHFELTGNKATKVWSTKVSVATLQKTYGITGIVYYGYRAWGPNWPYSDSWTKGSSAGFISDVDSNGNRFNPNKLLFDPYGLELSHDPVNATNTDGTIYASGPSYRDLDSGRNAPKSIVLSPDSSSVGKKPTRALKDDIIYEVHVRGLTKNDPSIPSSFQGTYKGAGLKASALASLGVTAVEFLPVQETQNDANDVDPTSTTDDNYWGYMTLNYFSPDRRYSADKTPGGPTREFKAMVQAFHNAGIKVFMDVVYNHTAEGGPWVSGDASTMNLMSFRGLDNPTYYNLTNDKGFPWDNTGVGGNYNTHNSVAQDLIIHSLAYFRDTLGVDGFRFDLASVLGNTCEHGCYNFDKFDQGTALNRIARDLSPRNAGGGQGTDFIAEPWAIGGNSYQVGNFPSGWSEWNGIFRDTLRKSQNQLGAEVVTPGDLAARFSGSSDLFQDDGRKPWNSINFMVAHDGMTLKDLYSCNGKNNSQPWPFGPSDGGEDGNHSWDQGGDASAQRKAARNGLAFLMLSGGTPMITGGDEFMRTQYCNNNAYNLDSDKNWLDYALSSDQKNFQAFAKGMIAFRKAHPALRPAEYYVGKDTNGNQIEQLRWFRPDGGVADSGYFSNGDNHAIAFRIDGTEFGDPAAAIYIAYNAWTDNVNFTLPWPFEGKSWYRVTDTCTFAEGANQVAAPGSEEPIGGEFANYGLCGRGVLVLIAK
jgi:glycogen operon protein